MTPLFKRAQAVKYLVLSLVIAGFSIFFLLYHTAAENNGVRIEQTKEETQAIEVTGPLTVNVVLQQHYLDGNTSEETVTETIWSMEDFWAQYKDWQLVDQKEGLNSFF
ncbi:BofC N-terminal domain-containing protein, partial [Schinkia azotoformans]|uniref:BofC N-terminal domain-containing protein n=1 Tax=Schinkia azotoformans TaxID=1454 RepID=UPI0030C91358